jgi:hypothetical protein
MSRSWCIVGFVNIVGSYGVFPSILLWWIEFSLWDFILSDWILLWIWEHLIYVLHTNSRGDNGVLYWFTWYMFWHSTHGFPRWHWGNLCIGVDACSCLCFSDRNLGALFEVLCVGLSITNLNLLWCYFSTNSWIDRSERIALRWFRTLQTIYSYVLR